MGVFEKSKTMALRLIMGLIMALIVSASAHAAAPRVLSDRDVDLYSQIFSVQERGDWDTADRLIGQLENRVLMGHVQFQRYMHPTAYRSRYTELRDWMEHYGDHPDAGRIYRLAMRRRPDSADVPQEPAPRRWRVAAQPIDPFNDYNPHRSQSEQRRVRQIQNHVRSLMRRERPTQSINYLNEDRTRSDLTQWEYDRIRIMIARSYYAEQRDDLALEFAGDVAARSRAAIPEADWWAGLAAWRLGEIDRAADHFAALARADEVDDWLRSSGAYWAARAYMVSFQPRHVVPMLEIAAREPLTFYGILATRQLGRDIEVNFGAPELSQIDFAQLVADPGIARAVAFTQLGRIADAEAELVRAHGRVDGSLDAAFLALTAELDLPHAQLIAAISSNDPAIRAAAYPLPEYEPEGGYTLDRALVYAFARQESKFDARATSRVGARGLMQVLPTTASYILGERDLVLDDENKLYDPDYNMEVGQMYIDRLMNRYAAGTNLFMLAVAYNSGPGNLSRWMDSIEFRDDPLLFIESIPTPETRGFIEQVFTNLWIYRARLGEDAPSLDMVARGSWPEYRSVDTMTIPANFN